MTQRPAGTVTFLLTDVEGSSRLWEADQDAAAKALTRRLEIIQEATAHNRGAFPIEQGEGDSSVSAFARASDAAACAADIQRALTEEAWPAGAQIRVRIAMHTGEAELLSDGTYRGPALNRCARVRAIGHGGQILVSRATYEVLADGLADELTLKDLGTYRLKDLARPEHVWQLCHAELPDAFPPLRSVDTVANNLPVQLTSFVGRESEIGAVAATLDDNRLVTLIGAGGSGKTRLALQVATRVADEHSDGVWWVDLAPLADPSLVPAALAAVVGVRESPVETIAETIVHYLAAKRSLLILDNCEHLIESSADLAARLVQGCPGVRLIATSREPLRVAGETTWPVPPLSLPDRDTDAEAVRLFVDRARASQPKFSIGPDIAGAVEEICTRLDGIPLAIELAAARTRLLTVHEIAAGLADRFHLLTGGARTALPRQRTLESSVDWSHDLLDEDERTVFRRLASFAGSFTLDAAEAVCSGHGIDAQRVLDLLTALVDRSLVQVADESGGQTRYRLLETIRDYARHKLTDAGEAEETRDRHLDHYVAFAHRAAAGLEGPDLVRWLSRIDVELDNIRAGLDWSPHSTDSNRGARIVGLLCLYFFARSELGIGRDRLDAAIATVDGDTADRAGALSTLCMVHYRVGEMQKAAQFGDEAITIARGLGDASLLGRSLHWRAWVRYFGQADRFEAWEELEEAATLFREADDPVYRGLNAAVLGWTLVETGATNRARDVLEEGLAATASRVPHGRCWCLVSVGYMGVLEGRFDDAVAHTRDAVDLAGLIGDHYAAICARLFLTYAHVFRGEYEAARLCGEDGLAAALAHRSPNGESFMRNALGFVEFATGRLDAAAAEEDTAFEIIGTAMPVVGAVIRAAQAHIALAQEAAVAAGRYASDAVELGRALDMRFALEMGLVAQALLARAGGDAHAAEDLLHEALDLAEGAGRTPSVCHLLEGLSGSLADRHRFEEAARLLGAGQALRDTIGYVRFGVHQESYEADVAVVRNELTADDFDRAWAEGAALSCDEAVAYARRGRGRRKRPAHGWSSLTPTEVQVVELVAEGLTNPQIGERLIMSKRTVQTHLAHVFAKLGVATRAELAAAAAERRATNA